jgi:uncharacterized protein
MLIDLTQLEKKEELQLDYQYPVGALDLQDETVALNSACDVSLHLKKRGNDIDASGQVTAEIAVNCDRCLAPLIVAINGSFNLIYLPIDHLSGNDELVLERQELDFCFYRENRLDLDELAREQILLALPMSNLCREDCRGLCRQCGQDLNVSTCQCVIEHIDPRWSALLDLKKKLD